MLFSIYHIVPITLAACASLVLVPAVVARMADRKSIIYEFERLEDYQTVNKTVVALILKDTGAEAWRQTRTLPPTSYPPPMTLEAIEKLKEIKGVIVVDSQQEL